MLTQFGQLPIKRQVMKLMPLYGMLRPAPTPPLTPLPCLARLAMLHACRLQTEEQAKHSEFNWQLMLLWSSGHLPRFRSPSPSLAFSLPLLF